MKIVFLDTLSLGEDIPKTDFPFHDQITFYDKTEQDEVIDRCIDAEVVILNKINITKEIIKTCKRLKLLIITATGVDNIDLEAAKEKGVRVSNAVNYASESVTHSTFASYFYLNQSIGPYAKFVQEKKWSDHSYFSYFERFSDLSNKTWGIIGLGNIGKRVAAVATAFGARVIYYSSSGKNNNKDYLRVSLSELMNQSDVISIHCDLNPKTHHLVSKNELTMMKRCHTLMNFARGDVINELDLANYLQVNDKIKLALDVSSYEPEIEKSPLFSLINQSRILITPHMSWASIESRKRLIEHIGHNLKTFFDEN